MILRYVFQAGEVLKWIAQKNNYRKPKYSQLKQTTLGKSRNASGQRHLMTVRMEMCLAHPKGTLFSEKNMHHHRCNGHQRSEINCN